MLGLVVVFLTVVLAVILVLFAFVYGADIATHASSSTAATTLVVQATQISNAIIAAQAEGLSVPDGEAPRLDSRFLANLPIPPLMAYAVGRPAAQDWMYFDGNDHAVTLGQHIATGACLAVNREQGAIGIPAERQSGLVAQCYGEQEPFTFYFRTGVAGHADAGTGDQGALVGPTLCPDGTRTVSERCAAVSERQPASLFERLRKAYASWTGLVRRISG